MKEMFSIKMERRNSILKRFSNNKRNTKFFKSEESDEIS